MSRKNRSTKSKQTDNGRVTPKTGLPASQRVEAPPCPTCPSEDTFVYATRRPVRYCKCRRCGHTYTKAMSKPVAG